MHADWPASCGAPRRPRSAAPTPLTARGRSPTPRTSTALSNQPERSSEPNWLGIGSGARDREGRPSHVRLDRVLEVGEHDIRREGAVLGQAPFDRVADALRARYGWT